MSIWRRSKIQKIELQDVTNIETRKVVNIDYSEKNIPKKNKNYYSFLQQSVGDNQDFEGILKYLPDFYFLICNIGCNKKSNWNTKMLVNAALSYLVLEDDLIPDKLGRKGHLDDLFICAYVLKEIRDKVSKNIILENMGDLEYGDEIFQIIYDVVNRSSSFLGEKTEQILEYVGLKDFKSLDFFYDQDKENKLLYHKEKMRLLYAMIAVKTEPILKKTGFDDKKTLKMKAFIQTHPEFEEIKRNIGFINK